MSSVADVDPELTLTQGSRTYKIKRATFKCEGWMVDWVRQRAFAVVETIPDLKNRSMAFSSLVKDIACGKYDWEAIQTQAEGSATIKQWYYFRMIQDNPVLQAPDDGWALFEKVWNDPIKGEELVAKYKAVDGPNPQTLPEPEAQTVQGSSSQPQPK